MKNQKDMFATIRMQTLSGESRALEIRSLLIKQVLKSFKISLFHIMVRVAFFEKSELFRVS